MSRKRDSPRVMILMGFNENATGVRKRRTSTVRWALLLLVWGSLGAGCDRPLAAGPREDAGIRTEVFRFQIAAHMRSWRMHVDAQRRYPQNRRSAASFSAPVFYIEMRNWNGTAGQTGVVPRALLDRLRGTGYTVNAGTGGRERGMHLYAGSLHWRDGNRADVDGGMMWYGDAGPAGHGATYAVERTNGTWRVVTERETAIT